MRVRKQFSSTTITTKTRDKMEKIIAEMKAQIAAICADIDKIENKAAKARVRKASLAFEKAAKEYRKISVK